MAHSKDHLQPFEDSMDPREKSQHSGLCLSTIWRPTRDGTASRAEAMHRYFAGHGYPKYVLIFAAAANPKVFCWTNTWSLNRVTRSRWAPVAHPPSSALSRCSRPTIAMRLTGHGRNLFLGPIDHRFSQKQESRPQRGRLCIGEVSS